MKIQKENIVMVDVLEGQNWEFVEGIREETRKPWKVYSWNNAGLRTSKFYNVKRFAGYFYHPLEIFRKRNRYNNIVAWQQFYGLVFAFYCKLFNVKKTNNLVVMTFIYKEKKGIIGKAYRRFIQTVIESGYIDKIIVFSRKEIEYYSDLFSVLPELFQYFPLGISRRNDFSDSKLDLPNNFLLSVGRSNRDYKFLMECCKDFPCKLVVLSDMVNIKNVPENVIWFKNIRGDEYLKILDRCEAVLIPLKDKNISSGQLVMLQAMQYKKPIVITESDTIIDYVTDGVNAVICKKEVEAFNESVKNVLEDKQLYNRLIYNGYSIYEERFSLFILGKNVGSIIQ